MKKIGPAFLFELQAANLLEGVSWSDDGDIFYNDVVTDAQRAAVVALLEAHDPNAPAPVAVPDSVTKYQCCVILARYGLLTQTNAFFSAMAEDDPRRLAWEMAATVQRNSASTLDAIAHLELSEAQADSMFVEAGQVG